MAVEDEIKGKEKEALDELRNRMKGDMDSEMYQDIYLFYRFLKARHFNVNKAEIMLRKHLEWREKYDVKNIFNFKKSEVMIKYVPNILLGYDNDGCIVRYFPLGTIDFKGFHKCCKLEDEIQFAIYDLESDTEELKKQSKRLGRNVDKCVYIYNCEKFSFEKATDKRTIYNLIFFAKLYQNNYPERIKVSYIINASSFFHMFFSIMKPFLAKELIDKIQVYSDDSWKKEILKHTDADVLPAFLGGTRTDPDGNPLCLTFINHGGQIPKSYYIDRGTRSLEKSPGVEKLTLQRAELHKVKLYVKEPGSHLEWEFEAKCKDIGFGLFYQEIIDGKEKVTEIIAIQRIDTTKFTETGTFKCENSGTYVIVFDNTYSWMRGKEIFYKVKVVTPQGA